MDNDVLLEIADLQVSYNSHGTNYKALDGVSLNVKKNEVLGIVGESGSGKSTLALSILGLLPLSGRIINGRIVFKEKNIVNFSFDEMRNIRGNSISIVFQNPLTHLNPIYTVGNQLLEVLKEHNMYSGYKQAKADIVAMLAQLGINDSEKCFHKYPHELSGGMQQRVIIAMALLCNPELLIADEPTTSLDVVTQSQILRTIRELTQAKKMSTIYISHNLSVVRQISDRVAVMYHGQIVEISETEKIMHNPTHPYTKSLLCASLYLEGLTSDLNTDGM